VFKHLTEQEKQSYYLGYKSEHSFTPEMTYHHNVFYYLSSIIHTVERIEQVPIYIRRFPNSKFFAERNITLHKWVNYHYTNFLIMSVSLYDIALLLTNELFMLGIEPRFCNENTVAKHKLVKKTSVKSSLDSLARAINEYRDPRNLFVHRGCPPSMGFMDDLESLVYLQQAEKELGIEETMSDAAMNLLSNPFILKDLYKMERRKFVKQVEQRIDMFIELLSNLFDAQQPIYDSMSNYWRTQKTKSRPTSR